MLNEEDVIFRYTLYLEYCISRVLMLNNYYLMNVYAPILPILNMTEETKNMN